MQLLLFLSALLTGLTGAFAAERQAAPSQIERIGVAGAAQILGEVRRVSAPHRAMIALHAAFVRRAVASFEIPAIGTLCVADVPVDQRRRE